jgi:hypothetical protein
LVDHNEPAARRPKLGFPWPAPVISGLLRPAAVAGDTDEMPDFSELLHEGASVPVTGWDFSWF